MTDREFQCPACGVWGARVDTGTWDDADDLQGCQSCGAVHSASEWPSRAVVSSLIARMAAAAEQRLAEALRADVRRHWSAMRAGRQTPGLLSARIEVHQDGVRLRSWHSDVETWVPTTRQKTLTLTLATDSPLLSRIHEQAWSGSYVVIPEVDIVSRWLLESVEARNPYSATVTLLESHEK